MAKLSPIDDRIYFLSEGTGLEELAVFDREMVDITPDDCQHTLRSWEYWAALRRIEFDPSDVVIDVGAQPSFVDVWIAKRVYSVLSVDNKQFDGWITPTKPGFDEWATLITTRAPNVRTEVMDGRTILSLDDTFDVMVSFSVLEHMEPGQDSLASREAYRVLKPGGLFVGTVDYGRPEEGVPFCELYNMDAFEERIVLAAPWKWVAKAPNIQPEPGARSAMVFVLQK